jgi:hypothetical protein
MMTLVKDQPTNSADTLKMPTVQSDGTERRRGLRIAQARPVKVFEHSSSRYFPGETKDVSATGLRIELPVSAPVRAGKLLSIHVGLSRNGETLANRRAMIPARVIWIDRSDATSNKTMTAGIEFLASIAAHLDAA